MQYNKESLKSFLSDCLNEGFEWIVKDECDNVYVTEDKPARLESGEWGSTLREKYVGNYPKGCGLLNNLSFNDRKPTSLKKLLKTM